MFSRHADTGCHSRAKLAAHVAHNCATSFSVLPSRRVSDDDRNNAENCRTREVCHPSKAAAYPFLRTSNQDCGGLLDKGSLKYSVGILLVCRLPSASQSAPESVTGPYRVTCTQMRIARIDPLRSDNGVLATLTLWSLRLGWRYSVIVFLAQSFGNDSEAASEPLNCTDKVRVFRHEEQIGSKLPSICIPRPERKSEDGNLQRIDGAEGSS
ncbi:hypothetical protein D9M69_125640 [compost metagenome]